MACNSPITAYATPTGGVVFSPLKRHGELTEIKLPCQQCMGCKIQRAHDWSIRIMHEAQLHEQNSFITLTYDNEHIPKNHALNHRDFQLFIKRLRKIAKIKYYMCGEYGSKTGRPHYHAAIFGKDFSEDRTLFKRNNGNPIYTSPTLSKLWPLGSAHIGTLTPDSATYVAGYITKKLTGDENKTHYEIIDPDSGEIWTRPKEYARMSLKPTIALDWLRIYWQDVKDGKTIVKGQERNIPKYYKKYFRHTKHANAITENQLQEITPQNSHWQRKEAQETILKSKYKPRSHE